MNKFNKLYNLILESIVSEGKQYRLNYLKKMGWTDEGLQSSLRLLNQFDNKTGDFLAKMIYKKDIEHISDPRIKTIQKIIKLQPSIDTQNWNGTVDQFIQKYQPVLTKAQEKVASKTIKYLDTIPEFTQKDTYPNGVIIYRVDESKQGQDAVRKIVDMQWGMDANPWCLIARGQSNWSYWKNYNSYPKHIAFQNGRLLAFCANNEDENRWWDRRDRSHRKLPLLDDTYLQTPQYQWTPQEKQEQIIKRFQPHLSFNEDTGRYDCDTHIEINDRDLIDGHFPVPFGVIYGTFRCIRSKKLTSLLNAPIRVQVNFDIHGCFNLTSLQGAPEYVGAEFDCSQCNNLQSLKGGPKEVCSLDCHGCTSLTNLEGLPQINHSGNYWLWACGLKSLKGLPNEVRKLDISENDQLTSLEGCPKIVKGSFTCQNCFKLTSLVDGPEYVGRDYQINDCSNLTSLIGAPKEVGGDFECERCIRLTTLEGAPKEVKGQFYCKYCHDLTSLKELHESKIDGHLYCLGCSKLKITEEDFAQFDIQPPKKDWYDLI